jgi:SAM-dependent methyltransferase
MHQSDLEAIRRGSVTQQTEGTIDQAKVEAFMGKMVGFLNGASMGFMLSIGHRTGLFDTLAGLPPATSEEIAKAAGLKERYVREWLGAVVTGGIVEYNPVAQTYSLPPEHAGALTRAAGPNNLARIAQQFSINGSVEGKLVDCFRHGGGVTYSEYPGIHEFISEVTGPIFDASLIEVTLPLVNDIIDRLKAGIDVADVGCGAGHAVNLMAGAFPNSRFVGYDFSADGIALAREEAQASRLKNARFEVKDAATLDGTVQFDFITVFDAIHDQVHPARVLKGLYDSLKTGGTFLCVDVAASSKLQDNIGHPLAPFLYSTSTMHCMTVSLAYGGDGLGTAWGEQKALEMLAAAGYKDVEVKRVDGDILNNYYIARK